MKKTVYYAYRLWLLVVCLGIALMYLLGRAAYLATGDPYALKQKQASLVHRTVTIKAPKGEFFDRHHYPLAMNVPRYRMFVDFQRVRLSHTQKNLLLTCMSDTSPAYKALWSSQPQRHYLYAGMVDYDTRTRIVDARITGVHFEELVARYYPLGPAFATVMGRVDGEGQGTEGLEKLYDSYLSGRDSKQKVKQDRLGRTLAVASVASTLQAGESIVLTIDHRIQHYAYQELLSQLQVSQASAGAVVVLNQAGEIIAMASAPSYHPQQPIQRVDARMKNRAVVDVFEPGSTIKPIAFVGLLHKLPAQMQVDTEGGTYRLGRFTIKDVKNYGSLSLSEVLSHSSNVAMIKLTQRVGGDVLLQTYKKFKLFEPSYAGLLGEQVTLGGLTIVPGSIGYYALSYGYGMEISLLQLAHAYVIMSNRGLDPGLHVISSSQVQRPAAQRVAQADTVERVVKMMVKVVDEGTGRGALIEKVAVAGKTGTTHMITAGKYDNDRHIASFVGFAPAEYAAKAPVYTIAVVIFEPKTGAHFGGQAAAPLFAKIMKYALSLDNNIDVHAY